MGRCGPLPEEARRQMYTLRSAGQTLLATVSDALDEAALRQSGLRLNKEKVGAAGVCEVCSKAGCTAALEEGHA